MLAATNLYIDNQAAIRLASNPVLHERSKHIELRHHVIRQLIALGVISVDYVSTTKQLADGFTKPLSGPKTLAFRTAIGLRNL
ncbi:hypothetical protein CspHIS471_0410710 [Cutaneotrichosporon sp. HIS471]|nr:hypothetical protein CspHIS471_0410710 [Cutaneotrichosporon sp. HIS471]